MIKSVKPKLNKLLNEKGLKQIHLAQMTGLPQGTISRFDRSSRFETLNMFIIARALNVNIEELFEVIESDE